MAPQREWFEKDYYKTLGVAATASPTELTQAYRKLARKFHPDANPDDASAEDAFKEISAAYDVLSDEARRKEYDEVRTMGPRQSGPRGFGGPGGPGGGFGNVRIEDLGDLGDIFGGMFGGGRGRRGGGGGRAAPPRGGDLETEITLAFSDAVAGLTTTLHLLGDAPCETCHGSGAKPDTAPTTCPTCAGRGVIMRDREVAVRIPAGVAGGKRIRLKGRGAPGPNGGQAGDLHVLVHVTPHPIFGRDGDHLTLTAPITFAEAALGAAITVPTLDGDPVTLKIPAGTRSGRTFRVRNRGIQTSPAHGDLLVTVEVNVPSSLTDDERHAIEALAAATLQSPRSHLGV